MAPPRPITPCSVSPTALVETRLRLQEGHEAALPQPTSGFGIAGSLASCPTPYSVSPGTEKDYNPQHAPRPPACCLAVRPPRGMLGAVVPPAAHAHRSHSLSPECGGATSSRSALARGGREGCQPAVRGERARACAQQTRRLPPPPLSPPPSCPRRGGVAGGR